VETAAACQDRSSSPYQKATNCSTRSCVGADAEEAAEDVLLDLSNIALCLVLFGVGEEQEQQQWKQQQRVKTAAAHRAKKQQTAQQEAALVLTPRRRRKTCC